MEIRFSHHRPRVERARPDVAIGWTVRVTIQDGETSIFEDISAACSPMSLEPPPRRADVDALIDRLLRDPNGRPRGKLANLIEMFGQRCRFADVHNFHLSED